MPSANSFFVCFPEISLFMKEKSSTALALGWFNKSFRCCFDHCDRKIFIYIKYIFSILLFTWVTALLEHAEAYTNNRPFQTVEPEKLTRKFYKKNVCALLGDSASV